MGALQRETSHYGRKVTYRKFPAVEGGIFRNVTGRMATDPNSVRGSNPRRRRRSPTEPVATIRVKLVNFLANQSRHIGLDLISDVFLKVGEMAIAFRESDEPVLIQRDGRTRICGIHSIFLVDRLAPHYAPFV